MARDMKKYEENEGSASEILRADYEKLLGEKQNLEKLVHDLTTSASWRLTKPLRTLLSIKRSAWPLAAFKRWRIARCEMHDVEETTPHTFVTKPGTPFLAYAPTDSTRLPGGWMLLSFKVSAPVYFHLSYDEGSGYSDLHKRFILLTPEKPSVAVRLPQSGISKFRIDFFETGEAQSLEFHGVQTIGSLQVLFYLLKTKMGTDPKYWLPKVKKGLQLFKVGGVHALRLKLIGDEPTQSYDEWVDRNDILADSDLRAMCEHLKELSFKPKISIIMPTYNTPIAFLKRAIESVQQQVYEHWELCIADDASPNKDVRTTLEAYAALDARIKIHVRSENGHISRTSNDAAALATGEFLGLLDHDDELRPHALYMNIVELNRHPKAGLIYSDEDKINAFGKRFNPYFKSDWNPELFTQQNFICHFTVMKRSHFEAVGGFRAGFEGSQDWDLFLRMTELLRDEQIRHIPHILYHWRAIEGSTAQSAGFKPYALLAAQRALQEHFERTHEAATVETLDAISQCRIRYLLPSVLPLVSVIIPTRDKIDILARCIASILKKTTYQNYEIIIIDNGSVEAASLNYFEKLQQQHHHIRVVRDDGPFNFSALNNRAVKQARGAILGFLNNDLEIINADWLSEMVSHVLRAQNGAVGARLWFPNNLLQHGGVILGIGGVAGHSHKGMPRSHFGYFNRGVLAQNFSAVTAACLLVRKEVFEQVGGFDEASLAIAFNDVDLCLKIREAGYWNVWTPYAEAYHYESLSRGYEHSPEKFARFEKESAAMKTRWQAALLTDPAYNPNLTVQSEDFKFAERTRATRPWIS